MNPKEELEELYNTQRMIESGEFQKFFAQPIYKALEELKAAYDCESLRELHALKGKRQGLEVFTKILKDIPVQIRNKRFDAE